jgi:hypothetical protein
LAEPMIVKTGLAEILGDLTPHLEQVCLKGEGVSASVYAMNQGRAVEICENNGGFWLEFWEKSDDEDAAPMKEMIAETGKDAAQHAIRWLRGVA